ncbi:MULTISPECIES: Gfo/Idh/MocA family protein [unclassified Vibrio]|uniref:Gfo/Idh/MocA family protein n=1 Tax=Vibrio TaxID=662 RepID=UPI0020A4D6EE|nr:MULTISPECIES: Gfo/Idh/MocA family oxidoreductase [unclassified Vibrio]
MLAIVGYGEHVKKNILPALSRMGFSEVLIYSRSTENRESDYYDDILLIFSPSVESLASNNKVTHVYIATPISCHYELIKFFVENKKNVLSEKTMTNSLSRTRELFELAKEMDTYLDEVCIYKHHKQYSEVLDFLNKNYDLIHRVNISFQIPHLDRKNIRYSLQHNGGALFDLGYYPLSITRDMFRKAKLEYSNISKASGFDVDTKGTAIFSIDNIVINANWALGSVYENKIEIYGEGFYAEVQRVFSKPYNLKTEIVYIEPGLDKVIMPIEPDDIFANIFCEFMEQTKLDENKKINVLNRMATIEQVINLNEENSKKQNQCSNANV